MDPKNKNPPAINSGKRVPDNQSQTRNGADADGADACAGDADKASDHFVSAEEDFSFQPSGCCGLLS
jgi:hypothetical protein